MSRQKTLMELKSRLSKKLLETSILLDGIDALLSQSQPQPSQSDSQDNRPRQEAHRAALSTLSIPKPTPGMKAPYTLDMSGMDFRYKRHWSDNEVRQVIDMANEGKTITEMSIYTGRHVAGIRKQFWKLGYYIRGDMPFKDEEQLREY